MNYKTQVFSEPQLKDLVNGKEVVTTSPRPKDEKLREELPYPDLKPIGIFREYPEGIVLLWEVGKEYQAVNEKGEKQWYCPKCNWTKPNYFMCAHSADQEAKHAIPLLVLLTKIEEKKDYNLTLDEGIGFTKIPVWLKTWRLKE